MRQTAVLTTLLGFVSGFSRDLDANPRTLFQRQDGRPKPIDVVHDSAGGYFIEVSQGQSQTMRVQLRCDTYYSWVAPSNSSTCEEGSCKYGNCK